MRFDYDLFVLGAGSGGVRAARFAAGFGARVGIADPNPLGGTCVNLGCIPKKLLVYSSEFGHDLELAGSFGWTLGSARFDWAQLLAHKDAEIQRLNSAYDKLLRDRGVDIHPVAARIEDPHTVIVGDQRRTARHLLIATGCAPTRPDFPGTHLALSSDQVFALPRLPRSMLVIGGGYIAVEFASLFATLGVDTTLAYRGELFLRGFDTGLREHLRDSLGARGLKLAFGLAPRAIEARADGVHTRFDDDRTWVTEQVLLATGRSPRLEHLGLESTRVQRTPGGHIAVDAHYQTQEPSILAIGDVIGGPQLTPVALAQGMAVARRLFAPEQYRPVDASNIPTAVFSQPSFASVGLGEQAAAKAGHELAIFESSFRPLRHVMSARAERIYIKLVVDQHTDRVLGAHMVGPEAAEIIQGLAVAMKAGATKRHFDETIGLHPSVAEEFVSLREPVRRLRAAGPSA